MNVYSSPHGEFTLTSEDWNQASDGKWAFAKMEGEEYFIKVLSAPIRPDPNDEGYSPSFICDKNNECDAFESYKSEVFDRLATISDGKGNLVVPVHYGWSYDGHFEIITYKGRNETLSYEKLAELDDMTFLRAMRVLCYNLDLVHEAGVVHGDLKPPRDGDPGNIMFSINNKGFPVLQIIDFDDSFLSARPLPYDAIGGTPEYYSPDLYCYKMNAITGDNLTTKSDVFTLGLIFHQYSCSGRLPDHGDHVNFIAYLGDGNTFNVNCEHRPYMNEIINKMLRLDPEERPTLEDVKNEIDKKLRELDEPKDPIRAPKQDIDPDPAETEKTEEEEKKELSDPYAEIEKRFLDSDPNIKAAKVMEDFPSLITLTYNNGSQVVKKI